MGILYRLRQIRNSNIRNRLLPEVARALEQALMKVRAPIPIIIICYNNWAYVKNTIQQLAKFYIVPIVIDNNSQDKQTIEYLKSVAAEGSAHIIFCRANFGHMIGFMEPIYGVLPEVFAYTDPDLQFSPSLPSNFLNVLADLTSRYSTFKAGMALDLRAGEISSQLMIDRAYGAPVSLRRRYTVIEWESRFWRFRLDNELLEVYAATIDTTFAVYRKSNYDGDFMDAVRVAGPYGAIHLPWYPSLDIMSAQQRVEYMRQNISTTWA